MNAYQKLEETKYPDSIDENCFSELIKEFRSDFLNENNYEERVSLHRFPNDFKNEILKELDDYLQKVQQREELRHNDYEKKFSGNVTTEIKEIYNADSRLKTLFDALMVYCDKNQKNLNVTAIHVAEYQSLSDLFVEIEKSKKYDSINKASQTASIEKSVFPIHFEDRSGIEFERLVFAYLIQLKNWDIIQYLGQTGNDGGRDIWGVYEGKSFCYQCANYRHLEVRKVKEDIKKLVSEKNIPDCFIVVCGGRVSANMRTMISSYAGQYGIKETEIWSGVEFEEKLRKDAPLLLKRFVNGEEFPEIPN